MWNNNKGKSIRGSWVSDAWRFHVLRLVAQLKAVMWTSFLISAQSALKKRSPVWVVLSSRVSLNCSCAITFAKTQKLPVLELPFYLFSFPWSCSLIWRSFFALLDIKIILNACLLPFSRWTDELFLEECRVGWILLKSFYLFMVFTPVLFATGWHYRSHSGSSQLLNVNSKDSHCVL